MPLHAFTSGLQLGYGLQPVNPVPVDSYSGPYSGGSTTAAVSLANSTIPAALRFLSLEVRVLAPDPDNAGQTLAYKYWYRGSTADSGLVEFSAGTSITDYVTSFNGLTGAVGGVCAAQENTFTALNSFNAGISSAGGTFSALTRFTSGITTSYLYASTGSTFASTVQISGGATLAGRVDVGGVLDVVGGTTLESTLDVSGAAKFNGNVTLGDASSDTVTANSAFQGITVSTNIATFNAGITTSGIYASTGSTFASTVQVNGGATLAGRVDIGGVLDVVGGTTLESTLDVGGAARFAAGVTFSQTTDHAGVARFAAGLTSSTIDTTGAVRVSGGLTASTLDVTNLAKFNGNVTLGDASGDTVTANAAFQGITVSTNIATFNAGVTTSFLYASTGSTFGSTVQVNGGATLGGRVDVGGVLSVVGGATFASTTDHSGVARFAAGLTSTTIDTSGAVRVSGGLSASSVYGSLGSTFASVLYVGGGATFNSTTDHAGVARFAQGVTAAGRVDIGGVLDVVGGTTLESTLDVSGEARLNGGVTAASLNVTGVSRFNGGSTFSGSADFASAARFAAGLTSSGDVVVGTSGTVLKTNGDATIGATLTVSGNFFVTGTVTTVNRTDLAIDDKIITLGRTLASDSLADGGGLVLKGSSDRTLTWNDSADAWTSNDNFNVPTGYGYKINNSTVLAAGMIHGVSASAGTITGATWAANIIGLAYGGTNKNLGSAAQGGVAYKSSDGIEVTSAGTSGQILKSNGTSAPTWIDVTSLTGLTAAKVKTTATNTAATYYLTFVTGASDSTDLYVDTTTGVTYDASTGLLSCNQLEAIVDGGTW